MQDLRRWLKEGQWIQAYRNGQPVRGWVVQINQTQIRYETVEGHTPWTGEFAVLPDEITPKQRNILIDLTLDLGDREWFESIASGEAAL